MSEVGGVSSGARRHFSEEDEVALRKDESTSSIVKRDTRSGVEIAGNDRTWRETKTEQQKHVGLADVRDVGHAGLEGAELVGIAHFGAAGVIGNTISGFALGAYVLHEAHEKADEQGRALIKDNAHVAVLAALDLPDAYKASQLEGELRQPAAGGPARFEKGAYSHVSRGNGSPAFKMAEGLLAKPRDVALLQLHADRGMNAAREMQPGTTTSAYLAANPKAADAYAKDAAFRAGFDAYVHTRERTPGDLKTLDTKLDARDGWYAQSQVSFRV